MDDLGKQFEQAVADSKRLAERPDNATMLELYALYKQAREGNATGERPGMTDFIGRAKWDAWKALEGTDSNDAMQRYVALVEELKG